jgi:uncharacterized C2H2 Zn-finger protein
MMKKHHHTKKRTVKRQKESGSLFYVGIRDPTEVHRMILECARDSIHLLQQHEKVKAIREEKIQTVVKLDMEVKQLRTLVNKLKVHFPVTKFHVNIPNHHHAPVLKCTVCQRVFGSQKQLSQHLVTHKAKKVRKEEPAETQPKKKVKVGSDLEQLEKELSDIEGTLGGMS